MSQILINQYLAKLERLKKVSGSPRETNIRGAFQKLLDDWGAQQNLDFVAEYQIKTAAKTTIYVDGALLHELRIPLGYWEAKDAADDLDQEIDKKFRKGYPQDNIIFSDDATAVLWQSRQEVMRCAVQDTVKFEKLLKLFFGYERPEIASFRAAVEQFKTDLPAVLEALRQMIASAHGANAGFRAAEDRFLAHAQEAINPALTGADVREMLIQHILTEEIFAKVFDDSDFHRQNNVARALYALESAFFTGALKKNTLKGLEPYYAAIRAAAAQIGSHAQKQTFLKVIYENFYKVYNAKAADRLGVVYTPNEIVRFMIDGADWLCQQHFGKNLIDPDVDILDPATGTGTFICELLEHFRGQPKKLAHKYAAELHANEVAILPYYVANLNIEATYAAITGGYAEFPNLCFVDTLDNVGQHTAARGATVEMFGGVSQENVERIHRQNRRRISVVIGNPPYNANQQNENDNNKNRPYPAIDARIKQTYIAASTAQKTKLYDMYTRFFRWASDRLDENGVLAFVTNRSFIDKRTFDGFRKTIAHEFHETWIVDLGGGWKEQDPLASGGNVFGIGTGVAISFLVKKPKTKSSRACRIRYVAAGAYADTASDKLAFLANKPLHELAFDEISPDSAGNWINQTHNDFETLMPLVSKETKAAQIAAKERAIFKTFGFGVSTNRDEWIYGESPESVSRKMKSLVWQYEKASSPEDTPFVKWSRNLKRRHQQGRREAFDAKRIINANYRPYSSAFLYNSSLFIDETGIREVLGTDGKAVSIVVTDPTAQKPWTVCAVFGITDLHFVGAAAGTMCIPIQRLAIDGTLVDNITDWALEQFAAHYAGAPPPSAACGQGRETGAPPITKEAIFHYCYAVLHDPVYRRKYAQNLKREFPRIPFYQDFWRWAGWGRALLALHIDYESAAPFALARHDQPDAGARAAGLNPKVLLKSDPASGSIKIDSETTLRGVPPAAWAYKLGNRCAIDWVLDQHKEKKPKDPTLRAQFDTYRFADYKEKVIDLLRRVTTVSVQTMRLVGAIENQPR